jgi:histidinol-phosphate aminotransferase
MEDMRAMPEKKIENLEAELFIAAKRLLAARAKLADSQGKADFLRLAERHGLEESWGQKLYEIFRPVTGLYFNPSIAGFESYAEKQRKRPEAPAALLDLANNENPLGPSAAVVQVLQDNLGSIGRYPSLSDLHLRQHLAAKLNMPGLGEDYLVLGRGVNHLISEIAFAFLVEGAHVASCRNSFPVYYEMVERSACSIEYVPVDVDYAYNIEAFCHSFREKPPKMVFIGSPNNPTGAILDREGFLCILECLPPDSLLVLDECYRDFADEAACLPDTFEAVISGRNVISLRSFSKAYGLAGLRIGYAVARPQIASYLEKRREPYHASQMGILACHAALDDSAHMRTSVELIRRERGKLKSGLEALGLKVWESHGNFLLFQAPAQKAAGDAVQAAKDITLRLEIHHGIRIRDLSGGFRMPGHLRVTVGLPQDNTRFLKSIGQVLSELEPPSKT